MELYLEEILVLFSVSKQGAEECYRKFRSRTFDVRRCFALPKQYVVNGDDLHQGFQGDNSIASRKRGLRFRLIQLSKFIIQLFML